MLKDMAVRDREMMRDWDAYQCIAETTGITREKLVDEQNDMINNNWELDAKMIAYGTKEEQQKTNKKTLLERITSN